ncbi:hypothetical protein Pan97_11430 [Bremerella volcania]|uniref:Uncharacterized protein n=1 Tax=Bremerella volcania TaxID=2527984 RepID=A0A518C4I5_9BACT|nr:hypothetical protein [Bremerella volcania]QDU74138.1 hypothetical protein Pan97_11430 [Bremerella volcania]
MSSPNPQPERSGKLSSESKPQVVVRAGKVYVCSSCGTLVEIPADVVGQLVIMVDPASQAEDSPDVQSPTSQPAASISTQHAGGKAGTASVTTQTGATLVGDRPRACRRKQNRPPRPRRPHVPEPNRFHGITIDGLTVPPAARLDRALAWVTFHLKVLDRQESEVDWLQRLLKEQRRTSVASDYRQHASGCAKESPKRRRAPRLSRKQRSDAHADVGMAPRPRHSKRTSKRGPP